MATAEPDDDDEALYGGAAAGGEAGAGDVGGLGGNVKPACTRGSQHWRGDMFEFVLPNPCACQNKLTQHLLLIPPTIR